MIFDSWRSLVGSAPVGYECLEYCFLSIVCILIINYFFKFLISFVRILMDCIKKK